jgi:hypothetical protein
LSEWITPIREPSAAYTFDTAPLVIGLRLAREGAELYTLTSHAPPATTPIPTSASGSPMAKRNFFLPESRRRRRLLRDRCDMTPQKGSWPRAG